jgi:multidrug efflux system outer membrane protein
MHLRMMTLISVAAFSLALTARAQELNEPLVAPPTVPEVSDPMLAPPPDASQKIDSWAQAVSIVRTRSPDYLANFATIRRAEAQTRMALAALLPVVTATGTYAHNTNQLQIPFSGQIIVTPPADNFIAVATAAWTPLNARAIYDYESTKRNVEASSLSFDDRRRQIALSVVSTMLATLSASRVAELNRVGLRSALERLQLTQARLQFGQGTPLDVDRASADVAAARRLIIDGDENLKRAREALGSVIGSREPVSVVASLDLEAFEQAVVRTCNLNDDIENRPDVRAARERVLLSRRTVTSALLAPLPTIGVVAQATYMSAPVLAPNGTFALEAVLTIPFYDGGYRYGQLRDAHAVEDQAVQALEQARLDAVVASARAKRNVDVSRADRDVSKTERDLAQRIDLRTRDAYARGRGTSLDLVISAQALRQAEINLAILDFQLAAARAAAVLENAQCTF